MYSSYGDERGHTEKDLQKTDHSPPEIVNDVKTDRKTATTGPTTYRRPSRDCRKSSRRTGLATGQLCDLATGDTTICGTRRQNARLVARHEKLRKCTATTLIVRLAPRLS